VSARGVGLLPLIADGSDTIEKRVREYVDAGATEIVLACGRPSIASCGGASRAR
jgi:hypothetical protein